MLSVSVESLNQFVIKEKREHFSRTKSGKSWKAKPDFSEENIVSAQHYANGVGSYEFFKRIGSSRLTYGYTYAGYLPVRQTNVSPDGTEKYVYSYEFIKGGEV